MLTVNIDPVGEMVVIECAGRIAQDDAGLTLRQAVDSQPQARIIVLDLSEVADIEGNGLGILMFLQQWALDRRIRLKLFNPRRSVRDRLENVNSMRAFDIATLDEMMALLDGAERRYGRVA